VFTNTEFVADKKPDVCPAVAGRSSWAKHFAAHPQNDNSVSDPTKGMSREKFSLPLGGSMDVVACIQSRHKPGGVLVLATSVTIQDRAGLVPHAAVIAGPHAEAVLPRSEVRVMHAAIVCPVLSSRCPAPRVLLESVPSPARRGSARCSRWSHREPAEAGASPLFPAKTHHTFCHRRRFCVTYNRSG
jgi:hypothetical protein